MLEGGRAKLGIGENGLDGSNRKKLSAFLISKQNVEWQRWLISAELPLTINTLKCQCGEQQVCILESL